MYTLIVRLVLSIYPLRRLHVSSISRINNPINSICAIFQGEGRHESRHEIQFFTKQCSSFAFVDGLYEFGSIFLTDHFTFMFNDVIDRNTCC